MVCPPGICTRTLSRANRRECKISVHRRWVRPAAFFMEKTSRARRRGGKRHNIKIAQFLNLTAAAVSFCKLCKPDDAEQQRPHQPGYLIGDDVESGQEKDNRESDDKQRHGRMMAAGADFCIHIIYFSGRL